MTFVYDAYLFHYIASKGVTFLCMADDAFGRRIPFAFLEDVKGTFEKRYDSARVEGALAFGLQEFGQVLEERVAHFNANPEADRFRQAREEIDQVKDVMVSNIVGI
jgi:vesicle-associated membrane protein 7